MTDTPILFSAPMVRAILREIENPGSGKTQTRRMLRNPEYYGCPTGDCPHEFQMECNLAMANLPHDARGYVIGDRLWVREAWGAYAEYDKLSGKELFAAVQKSGCDTAIRYNATCAPGALQGGDGIFGRYRHARFMPRWASRLTLSVTDVRVERLQDISEADAMAEGVERAAGLDQWRDYGPQPLTMLSAKASFGSLWQSINGDREGKSWADNPWIVAISFEAEERNIDHD